MLKRNEPEQPDELVWLNDTLVPVTLVPFGTFGDRFIVWINIEEKFVICDKNTKKHLKNKYY